MHYHLSLDISDAIIDVEGSGRKIRMGWLIKQTHNKPIIVRTESKMDEEAKEVTVVLSEKKKILLQWVKIFEKLRKISNK